MQVTAEEDGSAHFDAFQVSKQCMEMVAEGALEVGESYYSSEGTHRRAAQRGGDANGRGENVTRFGVHVSVVW